ncbi:hypothetical protein HYH03_005351 [Edaphochlamys debaryana]|uniref:Uncharacterized protein n=1 Tax=Edaphochlamys debaryana TaxID=47281 RepID=A0A836C271_9CHLO|nr:hypothetical protein HYH03_005351 [Edaphochlamys debaryana]|eukprot:KAG2496527.1 hypothetical protein HYH03_005351 [Edaphochlamys debaryana]
MAPKSGPEPHRTRRGGRSQRAKQQRQLERAAEPGPLTRTTHSEEHGQPVPYEYCTGCRDKGYLSLLPMTSPEQLCLRRSEIQDRWDQDGTMERHIYVQLRPKDLIFDKQPYVNNPPRKGLEVRPDPALCKELQAIRRLPLKRWRRRATGMGCRSPEGGSSVEVFLAQAPSLSILRICNARPPNVEAYAFEWERRVESRRTQEPSLLVIKPAPAPTPLTEVAPEQGGGRCQQHVPSQPEAPRRPSTAELCASCLQGEEEEPNISPSSAPQGLGELAPTICRCASCLQGRDLAGTCDMHPLGHAGLLIETGTSSACPGIQSQQALGPDATSLPASVLGSDWDALPPGPWSDLLQPDPSGEWLVLAGGVPTYVPDATQGGHLRVLPPLSPSPDHGLPVGSSTSEVPRLPPPAAPNVSPARALVAASPPSPSGPPAPPQPAARAAPAAPGAPAQPPQPPDSAPAPEATPVASGAGSTSPDGARRVGKDPSEPPMALSTAEVCVVLGLAPASVPPDSTSAVLQAALSLPGAQHVLALSQALQRAFITPHHMARLAPRKAPDPASTLGGGTAASNGTSWTPGRGLTSAHEILSTPAAFVTSAVQHHQLDEYRHTVLAAAVAELDDAADAPTAGGTDPWDDVNMLHFLRTEAERPQPPPPAKAPAAPAAAPKPKPLSPAAAEKLRKEAVELDGRPVRRKIKDPATGDWVQRSGTAHFLGPDAAPAPFEIRYADGGLERATGRAVKAWLQSPPVSAANLACALTAREAAELPNYWDLKRPSHARAAFRLLGLEPGWTDEQLELMTADMLPAHPTSRSVRELLMRGRVMEAAPWVEV